LAEAKGVLKVRDEQHENLVRGGSGNGETILIVCDGRIQRTIAEKKIGGAMGRSEQLLAPEV